MKKMTTNGHRLSVQLTHHTIASEVLDDVPQIEKKKFRIHGYEKVANVNQHKSYFTSYFFSFLKCQSFV